MRTVTHKSGMREYVPNEKDLRIKEGEDLVGAVVELARIVRLLDKRLVALEPDMARHQQLVRGETIPAEFIVEKKMAKIKRRAAQIASRIAAFAVLAAALFAGSTNDADAATELPVTGLHDYAYSEPFRYWSSDITYISDRLVEYLATKAEVEAARGSTGDLAVRLDEALNPDGTVKESAIGSFITQWQLESATPLYLDDSNFTVVGDATLTYLAGRRVLMHGSGGYVYATVSDSEYASPITVVTVSGGAVPGDVDEIRYGLIAESIALPEYTAPLAGTDATFSGNVTVDGTATIGTAIITAGKMPTGAGAGKVLGSDADGNFVWAGLGALAIDPDQVESAHVAEADGTSGQSTSTGTGIKTGHIQDSAVTLPKMGSDVISIAGTAYALVPRGGMIMWEGTFGGTDNKHPIIGGTPNTAWHICDGTDGTPDLRGRFIVGSGGTYTTGDTGGAAYVTHQHNTGMMWNTVDNILAVYTSYNLPIYGTTEKGARSYKSVSLDSSWHNTTSGNDALTSTTTTDNRPPYYALAFIQRI